jgi:hypothetical protein
MCLLPDFVNPGGEGRIILLLILILFVLVLAIFFATESQRTQRKR